MHTSMARWLHASTLGIRMTITSVAEWEIWVREGERLLAARRLPEAEECFHAGACAGAGRRRTPARLAV